MQYIPFVDDNAIARSRSLVPGGQSKSMRAVEDHSEGMKRVGG